MIGAQRCGTTRLYELLDAHPDIAMALPRRPEPKVFLSDDLSSRGIDWYRSTFFAHATGERVLGEKSTSYLEDAAAAGRAESMLGQAYIVAQFRDPVQRAISNWRFSSAHGLEERPLDHALLENLSGPRDWNRAQSSVSPFAYLERGQYVRYLEPWLRTFGDRVIVRFLEDDVSHPEQALSTLYASLGVDPAFRPTHPERRVNDSSGPLQDLDPELLSRLHDYFADSNKQLAELLGRDPPWRQP